jgi:hypothetical protein
LSPRSRKELISPSPERYECLFKYRLFVKQSNDSLHENSVQLKNKKFNFLFAKYSSLNFSCVRTANIEPDSHARPHSRVGLRPRASLTKLSADADSLTPQRRQQ